MNGSSGQPFDSPKPSVGTSRGKTVPNKLQDTGINREKRDEEKSEEELIAEIHALRKQLRKYGPKAGQPAAAGLPAEKTFHAILTAVPMAIGHFESGRLAWANKAFLEMFGVETLDNLVGLCPSEMYASESEYQRVRELISRDTARGARGRADALFRRRDGSAFSGHIAIASRDLANPLDSAVASISDTSWSSEAEEALRDNEQLLQNILAASPVGLCRLEDGKFRWVNEAMMRMFGADFDHDFVGKDTRMIFAYEDEYQRAAKRLYQSRGKSTISEMFASLSRKDGTVFDAHLRMSAPHASNPMKGTVAAISDVSWIVRAEEALLESERRFREILENVHLIALGIDVQGTITFCNDFLLEMTGMSREEVVGKDWFKLFVPQEHEREQRSRFSQLKTGTIAIHGKSAIRTRTGEHRTISWNNTILRDPSGNIMGLASIGEDITDKLRAETLMLQTERLKAVADMAGAVAHNFNNLLQVVMGGAQLGLAHLENGNLQQIKPGLEQIIKSSRLGAETVQRLQEFARVRTESTASDGEIFDLAHTVRRAVDMSEPWWKTNPEREGINVSLSLDLTEGCFVRGREDELFEVTVNLIKNAAEALPNGGVIRVGTAVNDGVVVLQVEDDGIGIPEADVGKVFEPFWTSKGFRGTGLGLSSSYGIVYRHRGEIAVESSQGGGTCFTIRLPEEPQSIPAREVAEGALDLDLRILLVDDMQPVLTMLEDGLTEFGQTVHAASSGRDALKIFQEEPIDLVICDLGMEGMNGWQVGEAIRDICRQGCVPKTPFILLTGWGGQLGGDDKLAKSGVDKVVSKPISINNLLEAARDLIRARDAGRGGEHPVTSG